MVAGGSGQRFGSRKQYAEVGGQRVVDLACATATACSHGVVVVLPADDAEREAAVAGGSTRTESVRNGLAAVPPHATIVCVHDAARPFASPELFERVIAAVHAGADAAVPGVPVTDTVKRIDASGRVIDTPPRAELVAVQTPQAFRASVLRDAHHHAAVNGLDATDDAALVEAAGGVVQVVEGEVDNRKLTTPADLEWARARCTP